MIAGKARSIGWIRQSHVSGLDHPIAGGGGAAPAIGQAPPESGDYNAELAQLGLRGTGFA
jgi:hypothetical protein